jgi:tetratricopeptide (TPR) repeat protein
LVLGTLLLAPVVVSAHAGIDELTRASSEEVRRHPGDAQVRLQHARVLQLAHQWDAALAELDIAALRGADADEVGAVRASILLDAGRTQAALAELDRVMARRPEAYGLCFERGRVLLALGRTEDAAQEFGRAIAGMPAPQPEHVIARRDALLALGRREEAVAALDAGMQRVGRVASLQLAAIDLEVELGRYDAALARLNELLMHGAANPMWMARRGEILARAGKTAAARAEYERALALLAARPNVRRVKAFDDLKRRLESELASTSNGGERQ